MKTLIETLSPETGARLLGWCREKSFGEGQVVFSEGDQAEFLPIVEKGKIKLVRYPDDGKELIIGIFSSGEVFAIPPAFDGKRYPATAVAMEPTRLLLLYREDFRRLLDESEEFNSTIMRLMCGLLRDRTDSVKIHSTASAETRVAEVLYKLAAESRQSMPVKIALRRQDIAEIAGLTTETTIRMIRKLADKGALRIERGKILIDSLQSLTDLLA